MIDPDRPVTRAELASAIELLRAYTQQATLMIASSFARDEDGTKEALEEMNKISDRLIAEFGADIPRG